MNGRSRRELLLGDGAGAVAVIIGALFVVVLLMFLYLVPLSRGEGRSSAQVPPTPATGAPRAGPSALAGPMSQVPGPNPTGAAILPTPPVARQGEPYADNRFNFELTVPEGWARAQVGDDERPALAADYDVVWEDPQTSARLAVSAWDGANLASFVLWSSLVGAGMQSMDGQLPTNAVVAGQPALLLWSAETPVTPARYALFLEYRGTYYRVAYAAHDGGAAIGDFARALATLRWVDSPDAPLVLPLRALPESRYWPRSRLYGGG